MAASSPGRVGGPSGDSLELRENLAQNAGAGLASHDKATASRDLTLENVLTAIKSRETAHAKIYDRLSSRLAELDSKLEEVTRLRRASDPQSPKMPTMTKLHSAPVAPLADSDKRPKIGSSRPPTPLSAAGRRNTAPGFIPTSASLDVPPLIADHDGRDRDSTAGSSTSSLVTSPMSEYNSMLPFIIDPSLFQANNELVVKSNPDPVAVDALDEEVVRV
ncbi:hypothetical protein OIV83_002295 [Microbotryomycetes sp. JL201]|nr:hypothetical protein OIV83_002295 [Microbotryomycetes sp. JL201]